MRVSGLGSSNWQAGISTKSPTFAGLNFLYFFLRCGWDVVDWSGTVTFYEEASEGLTSLMMFFSIYYSKHFESVLTTTTCYVGTAESSKCLLASITFLGLPFSSGSFTSCLTFTGSSFFSAFFYGVACITFSFPWFWTGVILTLALMFIFILALTASYYFSSM